MNKKIINITMVLLVVVMLLFIDFQMLGSAFCLLNSASNENLWLGSMLLITVVAQNTLAIVTIINYVKHCILDK
jgi:hypothetical protein